MVYSKHMKKLLILAIAMVLPISTHAFSLDDAIMNYINYLKTRIATLETENAELREQLADKKCEVTTIVREEKEEVIEPQATVSTKNVGTDSEGTNYTLMITGDFDTATLRIQIDGKYIYNGQVSNFQKVELNALKTGTYKYYLEITKETTKVITGEFSVENDYVL